MVPAEPRPQQAQLNPLGPRRDDVRAGARGLTPVQRVVIEALLKGPLDEASLGEVLQRPTHTIRKLKRRGLVKGTPQGTQQVCQVTERGLNEYWAVEARHG
jgi:hypothetical protein